MKTRLLQFRNGHLVNFSPEQFTAFRPSCDLSGQAEQYDEIEVHSELDITAREVSLTPLVRAKPISVKTTLSEDDSAIEQ